MDGITLTFTATTALITVAMLILWLIGVKIKDVSIIDMFWGAGFGLIAILCLFLNKAPTPYLYLLAALPVLWSLRYTYYIIWRNWGHGEDSRYTNIRSNVTEKQWPLYALRKVFVFQGLAMLIVAAPLWIGLAHYELTPNQTSIGPLAKIGAGIWIVGFLFESVGDWQLVQFKKNREKFGAEVTGKVMDKGLWKYTRHPNYFGNSLMWWGIWLVACQAPWGWASIIGPLFMTLALVKLTGAGHLERTLSQRPEYVDYMQRTPMFIPWFPKTK